MAKETAPAPAPAPAAKAAPAENLSKISHKTVAPDAKFGEKIIIAGTVVKITSGSSGNGDYNKLHGSFAAQFGDKKFTSTTCFLPYSAETVVTNAFEQGGDKPMDFAVVLEKKEEPTAERGYIWKAELKGKLANHSDKALSMLNI